MKLDGFLIGLIAVVALAVLWPDPGATGGFLHADFVSKYGVSVVFFLYGLTLAPEKMRAGLARWPVHIVIQLGTFVLFPLVVLTAGLAVRNALPPEIWIGFLYVAALPSTVSSSVAMTSMARGNVPVAIFNASLSSLIGVFATPALMAWFIAASGGAMDLGPVIAKVALLVLVPVAVGQIARRWLRAWAERHNRIIKLADRAVILAIVYNTFSDSIVAGVWSRLPAFDIAAIALGSIALFGVVYGIIAIVARFLAFSREDRIACLFCASKKSLATGVPLAPIVFGHVPALGLIIAPIMIFHFLQLVIVGWLAARFAREAET